MLRSHRNSSHSIAIALVLLFIPLSLAGKKVLPEDALPDGLVSLLYKWEHYKENNRQDSIIISGYSFLEKAKASKDTVSVQYCSSYIAQAYLLLGNDVDSTRRFIESISPYFDRYISYGIAPVYYNIMGHYNLKYELNYSDALYYYLLALDYAEDCGDISNQVVMLYNIVNIFYVRYDKHGLQYAEKAVFISESHDRLSAFHRIASYTAMVQMLFLSSEYKSAYGYLHRADSLLAETGISYWKPILSALHGDLAAAEGNTEDAGMYYNAALECSSLAEPSFLSMIYLNYGRMKESEGQLDEAISLYSRGLKTSYEAGNLEFRKELLKSLASGILEKGNKAKASEYFKRYTDFVDSLDVESKDRSFSGRLLEYSEMRFEYQLACQELELSENRRKLTMAVSASSLVMLALAVVLLSYFRQQKKYRENVLRYEMYRRRLSSEKEKGTDKLFEIIEDRMRQGAFRQKDLSLEKMASLVGSNRTYVSNTINKVADTTFYDYVKSYRVKEAIRVLSDPSAGSVSMKALADDVGFNSVQVFYKAFKEETGVTPGVYKSVKAKAEV